MQKLRHLNDKELSHYQSAQYFARKAAEELSPYLSLMRPSYSSEPNLMAKIDKHSRTIFGPLFFELSTRKAATVLIHEIMHPIFGNYDKQLELKKINIAEDLVINQGIAINNLLQFPEGTIFPKNCELPDNLSVAEYYNLLKNKNLFKLIYSATTNKAMSSDRISDLSDIKALDEINIDKPSKLEQLSAFYESSAIARAKLQNSGFGNQGSCFASFILKTLHPPTLNWTQILRNVVSGYYNEITNGLSDFSYRKTSRRKEHHELIFPAMIDYLPTVVVGVDTSGSMSEQDWKTSLSEIENLLKTLNLSTLFVTIDTKITNENFHASVKDLNLLGGGGTCMQVFYDYLEKRNKPYPDITILITDGEFHWSELKPNPKSKNIILATNTHEKIPNTTTIKLETPTQFQ